MNLLIKTIGIVTVISCLVLGTSVYAECYDVMCGFEDNDSEVHHASSGCGCCGCGYYDNEAEERDTEEMLLEEGEEIMEEEELIEEKEPEEEIMEEEEMIEEEEPEEEIMEEEELIEEEEPEE